MVRAIVIDEVTRRRASRRRPPAGWAQRWIYTRPGGGRRWLAIARELDPHRHRGRLEALARTDEIDRAKRLEQAMVAAVEGRVFPTVVGLGAGDARIDLELVAPLAGSDSAVTYVPVDLSKELLGAASRRLEGAARVPFGILADFEERLGFVLAALEESCPRPRLFCLTGNTLGNLDLGERRFLDSMRRALGDGDALLLTVATWPRGAKNDPLADAAGYSPVARRLIGGGMPVTAGRGGELFERRVRISAGPSDVPGAVSVMVSDAPTNRPLITIRRYRWAELLAWLASAGLPPLYETRIDGGQGEGAGVVLVARAPRRP